MIEKKEAVLEIRVLMARGKQTRKSVAFKSHQAAEKDEQQLFNFALINFSRQLDSGASTPI